MNRVLISQVRVATLLKNAGWDQPKNRIYDLFTKHHSRISGLVRKQTSHAPAKTGISTWYDYESPQLLTAKQAEQKIALAFCSLLGLEAR